MAAAFISGEAALLISSLANCEISDIKERIINSADRLSTLEGKTDQGRKINCSNALNEIYPDEVIEILGEYVTGGNGTSSSSEEDYSLYAAAAATGQFTSVVCGTYHTVALKNDGTVWTWGYNYYGQLGNGSVNNSIYPYRYPA